jgi:hypothetical protein
LCGQLAIARHAPSAEATLPISAYP